MKNISLILAVAICAGLMLGLSGLFLHEVKTFNNTGICEKITNAAEHNGLAEMSFVNANAEAVSETAAAEQAQTEKSLRRIITVSGSAVVEAAPDIAYLNMGVTQNAADSKTAYSGVSEKMTKIIETLKSLKVDAKDIQTSQLSVYPNYSYADSFKGSRGYCATNAVRVTVRDITALSDICSKATELGANQNFSIQFGVEDTSALYNKALKKAIENAESKAKTLAAHMNITLSSPTRIIEDKNYVSIMPRMYSYDSVSEAQPISSGEMRVSASVALVYTY